VKRLTTLIALLASSALVAAGCGGGSGSATEDALGFVPEDAPFVMAIDTDPDGEQWQNVNDLLAKFPGSGQAKSQFKEGVKQGSGGKIEYDRDIEPLLGNDLVIAITDPQGFAKDEPPVVVAMKIEDEDKARELASADSDKIGTVDGADIYETSGSSGFVAIADGSLVATRTREDIEAAIERQADGAGMTEDGFEDLLAGVENDGILRMGFDMAAVLDAVLGGAEAKKVPWVAALGNYGQAFRAEDDGIAYDFNLTTEDVAPEDLPLAEGAESPAVVRRAGEIGFGIRNAAQTFHFGEEVAKETDPAGFDKYMKEKERAAKVLGIDIDRDIVDQFTGDATVSVSLDGKVAFRSEVADPAAMKQTLAKIAPRLERLKPGEDIGVTTPPGSGEGLYAIARPGGQKLVFGLVGESFVAASDAARAAQVGGQSPSAIEGAEGALAMVLDARSVANAALAQSGRGAAAQLLTGALGDFVGSVRSETDGLSGSFKLEIK
jgi:hypothetical protein